MKFKFFAAFLLICQVAYSYFGGEVFPFTTFNIFSKRRVLQGQVVYRAAVSLNPERYEQEGISFHVSKGIKYLYEERKLPLSEIENHFKFPIYAIDKFTLRKGKDLSFFSKKRIFEKSSVQ